MLRARCEARLDLVNPASDSAVTVSVTFYLDRGKQLTLDRHVIPPNGMKILDPYVEGLFASDFLFR